MPDFIDAFKRAKPRLLATAPLIAAGAVASFAMAPGVSQAVLIALANLAGGIAATDVHAMLSSRVLRGDVLTNHDLSRAVRRAVSEVIHLAAADISDKRQRAALERIAVIDEKVWAEAESSIWQPGMTEGLSTGDTIEMFSKSPEEFARFKALDPESWRAIVEGLAALHSFAVEGDAISSPGATVLSRSTIDLAASCLHESFPRALYEVLKDDFAHGGEAYGGLLIKLVGNISAKQVETLATAYKILDVALELRADTKEIKQDVKEIKKAVLDSSRRETRPERLAINLPPFNPIFTGREGVLKDLKAALEKRKRAALSGMPGVGKTQTATEYAHRQYEDRTYDYVLYARAASETELLTDFVSAAHALNLPAKGDANFNVVAASVKAWLEGAERWLLIFDNADDLAVVHQHIPSNPRGHVVLTRRPADAVGVADTIRIEEMEVDEGAWLLLKRAELTKGAQLLNEVSSETAEKARAISRELGGLPLSLDIAGAFIKTTPNTSLAEYLRLYRAAEGRQLRRERDPNAPYEHSVATAFGLAFKQVATPDDETEESAIIAHAAADLLRLCAFLAPDAIPLDLILADASELGEDLQRALANTIWRKKVIARTTRYSLLDANPQAQTYDMHREVQAVMRDELDDASQRLWTERALQTLAVTFPDVSEFADWEACDLLLPHAQSCLEYCDRLNIETETSALMKSQAGFHLFNRVRYEDAQLLYEQALELWKNLFGLEHPEIATGINNLAAIYDAQGQYEEAEPLYEQALELRKRLLGSEHPDVAASVNNLATLYQEQGRYEEAEPLYEQALELRKRLLGSEHPDVAASMNNLAELYRMQGRYEEAEPLYKQALELLKNLFSLEHPYVAASINNLALLYKTQGWYKEAEPLYEQALELRKRLLGSEHPSVAASMNNLASLYDAQGRYEEAEPLYKQALELWKNLFGLEHPYVAASINNLALLYKTQGWYKEAEPLYEQALELRKRLLGSEHPNVAGSMNNLASLYEAQGRYKEAEPLYKQALAIFEKTLGVKHPSTHIVRGNFEMFQKEKAARDTQQQSVRGEDNEDGESDA